MVAAGHRTVTVVASQLNQSVSIFFPFIRKKCRRESDSVRLNAGARPKWPLGKHVASCPPLPSIGVIPLGIARGPGITAKRAEGTASRV